MKKIYIIATLLAGVLAAEPASAWSGWGHQLIAYIAEKHLTPEARTSIEGYLGTSIVDDAAWMDRVASWNRSKSHIAGWEQTSWWHMCTVGPDGKPDSRRAYNGDGDLLPNLNACIENLRNYRELTDSARIINLRCVVHMVGDMHCPSHIYFTEFPDVFSEPKPKDPNVKRITRYDQFPLTYEGQPKRYHGLWDGMSIRVLYPEFGDEFEPYCRKLDKWSKKKISQVCEGSVEEWVMENARNCRQIYDWAHPNDNIDRSFFVEHQELSKSQLVKAAYRLAHILNGIFGE